MKFNIKLPIFSIITLQSSKRILEKDKGNVKFFRCIVKFFSIKFVCFDKNSIFVDENQNLDDMFIAIFFFTILLLVIALRFLDGVSTTSHERDKTKKPSKTFDLSGNNYSL